MGFVCGRDSRTDALIWSILQSDFHAMSLKQFLENVLVLLSVKVVANFFGYIYVMLAIAPSNANSTVKCIIRAVCKCNKSSRWDRRTSNNKDSRDQSKKAQSLSNHLSFFLAYQTISLKRLIKCTRRSIIDIRLYIYRTAYAASRDLFTSLKQCLILVRGSYQCPNLIHEFR